MPRINTYTVTVTVTVTITVTVTVTAVTVIVTVTRIETHLACQRLGNRSQESNLYT